jgi:dienelactone hydrolase
MRTIDTTSAHRFDLTLPGEADRVVRGRVLWPERALHGEPPWPFVLLLHGFKGFMDWGFFPLVAQSLASAGIAAVAFNTSGSGIGPDLESFTEDEAFAKDTCTRQLRDIEAVRTYVARELDELCDGARSGVFGHSRGGGMALIHAAERGDYRAVVTWSAVPGFARFDAATVALWRAQGFIWIPNARLRRDHRLDVDALLDAERHAARLDVTAACARLSTPTLLVHGAADEVVEVDALERLRRAFRVPVATLVVPGAGHTFGASHPLRERTPELDSVLARTVAWFTEHFDRVRRGDTAHRRAEP